MRDRLDRLVKLRLLKLEMHRQQPNRYIYMYISTDSSPTGTSIYKTSIAMKMHASNDACVSLRSDVREKAYSIIRHSVMDDILMAY